MNKKAMRGWVIGIPLLVLVLMVIIVRNEPKGDGLSRAMAGRAVTLALCSGEELDEWKKTGHKSFFSVKQQDQWYVPYMDYLYHNGYLDEAEIPATGDGMVEAITYGELEAMLGSISDSLGRSVKATRTNRNEPYPKEQFAGLYETLLADLDPDGNVEKRPLMLYGTPANVENSKPWMAYTNLGDYRFDGLALDSFIDREIEVYVRGRELIWMNRLVSDYVVYKNAWVMEGSNDDLLVFLGSIRREMSYDSLFGIEKIYNQVADISLKSGRLDKIAIKKDRIRTRVLSVHDTYLDLEGYGALSLDEGFRVLKIFGQFEEQTLKDILVGYDMQEFVVAGGKICAALTVREFDADRIRVLLMTTGFKGPLHQSVRLVCEDAMTLTIGSDSRTVPAGEELEFTPESADLAQGRVILQSNGKAEIKVLTIERGDKDNKFNPMYDSQMEIAAAEGGLVIVNDIYMEDYLKKVVPSEMPATYEMEALKAQAVCARTYAFMQIQQNRYQSYGAHVDDSTGFQVYNNIATDTRTDAAVQDTYGELLTYQGSPVSAYYFSTSCGATTDGSVWGVPAEELPYLKSVALQGNRASLDLTDNQSFAAFIKNQEQPSYDSGSALYRWQTTITSIALAQKVEGIGLVESVKVVERGSGGFVNILEITGSEGTRTIKGQNEVRAILGDRSTPIKKGDGGEMTDWSSLPSAFVAIESGGRKDDGVITFYIYGGGYGHGAGMSQNGAQGMAKQGKNYQDILQFFYDGVEVGAS